MKVQELCDLSNLLKKWKKEYPFTKDHHYSVDLMIVWVDNLIRNKVNAKEL